MIRLTKRQYETLVAYRIDPLMAAQVEIIEPDCLNRWNGERFVQRDHPDSGFKYREER